MLKGRFTSSDAERALSDFSRRADFVLGHNILDHDLPILRRVFPNLRLNALPLIDTLFLSPIVFPENPYHHLVKDYRLLRTALNDPLCDARNAGLLFRDQCSVLEPLKATNPALLRYNNANPALMEPSIFPRCMPPKALNLIE